MARPKSKDSPKDTTTTIGFEAKLWLTADKLRNNMAAAEPSGARQPERSAGSPAYSLPQRPGQTAAGRPQGERGGANQYKAENVFRVPADARRSHLQGSAKFSTIGKTVDDALIAIERGWRMSNAKVRMWN